MKLKKVGNAKEVAEIQTKEGEAENGINIGDTYLRRFMLETLYSVSNI